MNHTEPFQNFLTSVVLLIGIVTVALIGGLCIVVGLLETYRYLGEEMFGFIFGVIAACIVWLIFGRRIQK